MKKVVIALILVTIAALGGGAWWESKQEAKDADAYKPTGKLVDVAGRKLHLSCAGSGAPTVIFEASGLSSSTEWDQILPEVAKKRRACAYDRAGMGWSDAVAGERTAAEFVDELRGALTVAGEKAPYVLVGHSAGGVLVRAWQAAHPDDVVGVVLVDTVAASMVSRWPKLFAKMRTNVSRARLLATVGLLRLVDPLHLEGRSAAQVYRPRTFVALDQLLGADAAILPSLPPVLPVPTVVLTHARGGDWAGPGAIGPVDEAAVEYDWQAAQKELAKGPKTTLVVADKSGHMIPAEQPELVLQAVESVANGKTEAP